jgi:amino acid permease
MSFLTKSVSKDQGRLKQQASCRFTTALPIFFFSFAFHDLDNILEIPLALSRFSKESITIKEIIYYDRRGQSHHLSIVTL